MSDSVTKWHEMQEEKKATRTMFPGDILIYESPDGGKTIKSRPMHVPKSNEYKKEAYTILCNHSEEAIKLANKILNVDQG